MCEMGTVTTAVYVISWAVGHEVLFGRRAAGSINQISEMDIIKTKTRGEKRLHEYRVKKVGTISIITRQSL